MKDFFEDGINRILFFMLSSLFIFLMVVVYDIYKHKDDIPKENFAKCYLDGRTYKIPEKDLINLVESKCINKE